MTQDWYARVLKRMDRFALVLAFIGASAFFWYQGWHEALGFAFGALISRFSFGSLKSLAGSVGEQGPDAPADGTATLLGIRSVLIGGAVFVIIRVLRVSAVPVVAGLLVTVAAVLTELVRQLVRGPEDRPHI